MDRRRRTPRAGGRKLSEGGSGALRQGDGGRGLAHRPVVSLDLGLVGGGHATTLPPVRKYGRIAADEGAEILCLRAAFDDVLRASLQLLLQRRPEIKRYRYRLGAAFSPRAHYGLALVVDEAALAKEECPEVALDLWRRRVFRMKRGRGRGSGGL
jgi:hypothetical protein